MISGIKSEHIKEKKPLFRYLTDSGLIIAVFTFVSYIFTYGYNIGWLEYFNLPKSLCTVSVNQVFNSVTWVCSIGLPMMALYGFLSTIVPRTKNKYIAQFLGFVIDYIIVILFAAIIMYCVGVDKIMIFKNIIVALSILIIVVIILISIIHIKHKTIKGFGNKINEHLKEPVKQENTKIYNPLNYLSTTKTFWYLFLISIGVLFVYQIGIGVGSKNASKQKEFIVIDNAYVVILPYNDSFIIAPYESGDNIVGCSYSIIPANESSEFTIQDIGPFKTDTSETIKNPHNAYWKLWRLLE